MQLKNNRENPYLSKPEKHSGMDKKVVKKDWNEIKTNDTWQIFRIMSEFVEGFEKMSKLGPAVTIFGSARSDENSEHYRMAVEIARKLAEHGYGIITGGGPGIMEAANRGAKEAGTDSIGLNIDLPFEQEANDYIDPDKLIDFRYFFVRKVMFVKYAQAFVVMPGGFGTLDELFEAVTLIQTKKIHKFPVILFDSKFWEGLLDWIKRTLLEKHHYISPEDLDIIHLTDDPDEVVRIIDKFYEKYKLRPNF